MRRRRRRLAFGIGLAVLVCAVTFATAAISLSGDDGGSASSGAPRVTSVVDAVTTTAAPPPTSTPTTTHAPGGLRAVDTERRYGVGTHSATYVDDTRSTSANGDFGGAANRTIPVEFWYPAVGAAGGGAVADAPPDRARGPYPLVLFSHGYAVTPDFYRPLLERWAAAGYVVAAPVYPILSGTPGGASHTDYEKTFDDARFVISHVLALPASDAFGGLVDPERIAAAGHSDGEVVAFAEGLLECCRDQRVLSVIAMAGDLSNANNPHVRDAGMPILHVMDTEDEYDPYQHSIDWDRANLDAPRWLLSLLGASHVPPYTQPGDPAFEVVSASTIAFLDGTLKGHPERLDAIASTADASNGVATLER